MRWSLLAAVSPFVMFSFAGLGAAQTPEGIRVSGPVVHENLAVYFIHGPSAPGKVPLTLEEAMAKGVVKVSETATSTSSRSKTSARRRFSSSRATS